MLVFYIFLWAATLKEEQNSWMYLNGECLYPQSQNLTHAYKAMMFNIAIITL